MTKFFDALLGRTKQAPPNLDALFALPSAAITLETEAGLVSSGQAGVCFKPMAEASFDQVTGDMSELLTMLRTQNELQLKEVDDSFGYHWVVLSDPDINSLVSNTHLVNSSLQDAGFGPRLLCSVFGFAPGPGQPAKRGALLVYLFKRGSFYPFAPSPGGGERRDNEFELHLKGILAKDLHVEEDLARWFPVWGAPVT